MSMLRCHGCVATSGEHAHSDRALYARCAYKLSSFRTAREANTKTLLGTMTACNSSIYAIAIVQRRVLLSQLTAGTGT